MDQLSSPYAKEWKAIAGSAVGTGLLLVTLMFVNHYAPFGSNSFAQADANIQYLDFFSYLKHILQGGASWTFSFSRGIGGNVWAVLTYYLFSPWNLLIIFFSQENLHDFYDTLVVIKLSLSAMAMSFYLSRRFDHHLPHCMVVALGMCFGMMQYNLEQARNVMWLDGVYLLPIILYGVYQIRRGKSIFYLVMPSALAMFFNWYTGLIDLLFAGFWAIWEAALMKISAQGSWKDIAPFALKVVAGIILSVGAAAIVFVPTYIELLNGRVSSLDWGLFHLQWQGSMSSVLKGMTWGTFSTNGHVSLFAGSLVFIGVIGLFAKKVTDVKHIFLLLLLAIFSIAVFYWNPLFLLFSLLKDASSYWYRYSYVVIFSLIWMAGYFFSDSRFHISKLFIFMPFSWILLQTLHAYNTWHNVIASSILFALLCCILGIKTFRLKYCAPFLIVMLAGIDLGGNANYIMRHQDVYRFAGVYHDYVQEEKEQISSIQDADRSFYRTTQTKTFSSYDRDIREHITANYNEGLAYLYPTVASYTSSPVNAHLKFLNNLGYRQNGVNMNIVNTSLLGADSLLGVRYVLSDVPITGLVKDEHKISANEKDVYQNPFALPIAFRVSDDISMHHSNNNDPFLFTNKLYQDIFKNDKSIYLPIAHHQEISDGMRNASFSIISDTSGAVYGNFPFYDKDRNAMIKIGDTYMQRYACWLSPSVIFIPIEGGQQNVQWKSQKDALDSIQEAQFYQVNEAGLKSVSDMAWRKAADIYKVSDTDLHITVDAENEEMLFTSIPVHKGWKVMRNGKEIDTESFEDCLMVIPLEPGHNDIILTFELPGWKLGVLCTIISLFSCFAIEWQRKYRV